MGHSKKVSYSNGVSENEGRKFNRALIKYINVYIQDALKRLKKIHGKPNFTYLVK